MRRRSPPLRFLVLAVGGWVCVRTAMIAPQWWIDEGAAAPATGPVKTARDAGAPRRPSPVLHYEAVATESPRHHPGDTAGTWIPLRVAAAASPVVDRAVGAAVPLALAIPASPPMQPAGQPPPMLQPVRPEAHASRWTGSAWLLVRGGGGDPLARGGSLGGSQAGARVAYRIAGGASRPLSLSARLYSPAGRRSGSEAAIGLDWRPAPALPLNLLVERRQALGPEGRSAFSLTLHGGVSQQPLPGGLRLDAYGQAGMVGARSRDLFADGAARISAASGGFELGAGLWGGAQPGAARIDAGPQIALRLPAASANLRLSAEWRFRIAGDASPGSGPSLTLSSDF